MSNMIRNDGLCTIQMDYLDDPHYRPHQPIQPIKPIKFFVDGVAVVEAVSLITFTGSDGLTYHVNPCRNCGLLITYAEGEF